MERIMKIGKGRTITFDDIGMHNRVFESDMVIEELLSVGKPILFNTDMVMAILDNRKTATRRSIKGYIPSDAVFRYSALAPKGYISCRGTFEVGYGEKFFKLPCQKGDILYVRETWAFMNCINCDGDYRRSENAPPCYDTQAIEYDDGDSISDGCFIYRAGCKTPERITWHPSIHMPKEAARIWLKVSDVRVERLQEINGHEVLKEGINSHVHPNADYFEMNQREKFINLWNLTVKRSEHNLYGWDANPWVWVIDFERVNV